MAQHAFLPPENFLGLGAEHTAYASSQVVIVPIPFEATVSYMGGTKNGPRAIIQASMQVELYDRDFRGEPALDYGVHTLPCLAPGHGPIEATLESIAAVVAEHAAAGKLVVGLGGEHTVSVGVGRGLAAVHGTPLLTVQLDAHADLRDEYEGSRYSHACAARRLLELGPVVQLGIRSLAQEEADLIDALADQSDEKLRVFFAEDVHAGPAHLEALARRVRGRNTFLTIDADCFDPAYVPATGTPEPGGLNWQQVMAIVRTVARNANVVGFDVVELAPHPGMHAADFLIARLVYKTISEIMAARRL